MMNPHGNPETLFGVTSAPSPSRGNQTVSPRSPRILLVEDNHFNQEIAAEFLAEAGFEVALAENGAVGVERAQQGQFDLILMDLQMPVMNGDEAARLIRLRDPSIPIIAMTANNMPADRARCEEVGMNGHLAKPLDPDALLDTIANWLGRQATTAATPEPLAAGFGTAHGASFPAIEGIDTAGALSRLNGRADTYRSLLKRFVAEYRDAATAIRAELAVGDAQEAERLVHSMRGVAANVGATQLSRQLAGIERGIREGAMDASNFRELDGLAVAMANCADAILTAIGDLDPQPVGIARAAVNASNTKPTVLVVDDVPAQLDVLRSLLEDSFNVLTAETPEIGLAYCAGAQLPDIILLDIMMPQQDGFSVCRTLKLDARTQNIPVIFLTSKDSPETEERGLALGAADFIVRPVSGRILRTRLQTQLQIKRSHDFLHDRSSLLEAEVRNRSREIQAVQDATIFAITALAEARDNETGNHIRRTQNYVRELALELRRRGLHASLLTDGYVELLFKSAPLHDIGKVGIPDSILLKPGKLSPEEFEVMKTHTTIGREVLERAERQVGETVPFFRVAKEIALGHHEKWDGSGYPKGLCGETIPLSARLMAVADVYDALISQRVYKKAMSHEDACLFILDGAGRHFDPQVVAAFEAIRDVFFEVATRYADEDCHTDGLPGSGRAAVAASARDSVLLPHTER